MMAALAVLGALALATAAMVITQRGDRRSHEMLEDYWDWFWKGAEQIRVTVTGARAQPVKLGRLMSSDPIVLESEGFSLRADNGQVLQVPAGTEVTLYAGAAQITGGRVALATGTRLAARVVKPPEGQSPFRADGRSWQIPDDVGLMLSDQILTEVPFAWAQRKIHWLNLVAFWGVGAALAGLAFVHWRLGVLGYLYALALTADAILLRGSGVFWFATTEELTEIEEAQKKRKLS